MSRLKAIIFDVFETLYANTHDLWLSAFEEICRAQRLWVDPDPLWQRWRTFEGEFRKRRTRLDAPEQSPPFMTYEEAWRIAFQRTFGEMGLDGDPAQAARTAVLRMGERPPYDDAAQALPQVRQGPWKLAILSNADNDFLNPVLERWPLTTFDVVVSSELARAYKPHPHAFHTVMQEAGVTPEEAVYIGDNPYDDVHGAKLVGLRTIWVNRNGTQWDDQFLPPDHEVHSLTELPALLATLEKGGPHD